MKLSIIVPVYNVEPYIEQCLQSIANQSFKDFECIVVNDGSTDKSGDFCKKFSLNDSRFHIINQSNKGLAIARKVAFSESIGDYIGFVDSDDYIDKDMFAILMSKATSTDADVIICDWWRIGEKAKEEKEGKSLYNSDTELSKKIAMRDLATDYMRSYMWNKLFKRSLLQNSLSFMNTRILEDYACMHYIFDKAESFYYVSQNLYYYRYRPESIMGSITVLQRVQIYTIAKLRYEFYRINYPCLLKESKIGLFNHAWPLCKNYPCPKEQETKKLYLDADSLIKDFFKEFIKSKAVGKKERLSLFLYVYFTKEVRFWKSVRARINKVLKYN